MKDRQFVRLPQGGRKMYTDGKHPQFEDYSAGDFSLDVGFVLAAALIFSILLTIVIFCLWN